MPDTDFDPSATAADLSGIVQLMLSVVFLWVFLKLVGLVANALEAAPVLEFETPLDDVTETITRPMDDAARTAADWVSQ